MIATPPRGLLAHAPTTSELERLYEELAKIGAPSVGRHRPWRYRPESREALVALAGEMLRHDPRLLTILLQLFLLRWRDLNPLELRLQMARMRWPQALGVVLGFVRLATSDPELRHFADYLMAGWPRLGTGERFFFDAERPGSRTAERRLGRNLAPYAEWGFVGTERPIADAASKRTVGRYDARTRRAILLDLVKRRGAITLGDYLQAVDRSITRQQALADLRRSADLELVGRGRGARWRLREVAQGRGEGGGSAGGSGRGGAG